MGILEIVLLVIFVLVAIILVLLVLIQNEEGDSLGGIFAGGSASAFGSRSGNVLTRATSLFGAVFLILSLGLALMHRAPRGTRIEAEGRRQSAGQEAEDWYLNNPESENEEPSVQPETGGE